MITMFPVLFAAALTPSARMSAARSDQAPRIDGHLDEPAWAAAPPSRDFVQRFPLEGEPPSEATTVRVLYDAHAIYIGIACDQRNTPRLDRLTRRDRIAAGDKLNRREGSLDSDQVVVTISSRRDRSSAFRFGVNSAGTLSDGLYYDDVAYDPSWDENWEAITANTATGWSVELRIPLRVLRFEAAPAQSWGFNVQRTIAHRQEVDEWANIPRQAGGYVSLLGTLEGLVDLAPPRADLELRPFVVGKIGRQDASFGPLLGATGPASWAKGWNYGGDKSFGVGASIGADARWHLTRDLTLDATFNPDFGQVEVDQLVLNLTTIETFFPEKRPFFLEGFDIFATPLSVLYTRRIGHVPATPAVGSGETLRAGVGASALPGALKLVGRLTDRTSVGLLSTVSARNTVPVSNALGNDELRLADPTTLFNVLRLRRAVGDKGGYLGLIGTATNRFEAPALYPTVNGEVACPGRTVARASASERCFRDAYVGGVDGRWRSASGDYYVSGQSVASTVAGGQPSTLRDGTNFGPGATGTGMDLTLGKDGGRRWLWSVEGTLLSRKLELNDVGYLGRANQALVEVDINRRTKEPWGPTLETASKIELRHGRNLDGLVLRDIYQVNSTVLLRNYWTVFLELQYRARYFDDREVGDGTALERAGLFGVEGSVRSDPRRNVAGRVFFMVQRLSDGWYGDLDGSLVVRPSSRVELELLPDLIYSRGEPRFMEAQGPTSGATQASTRLLFGRLEAGHIGVTGRMTYTFTPRLSLQTYAQLFLAAGRYSELSEFDRAAGTTPVVYLRDLSSSAETPTKQRDFQRAALNATLLLRWEYRLGSVLYLVYTRSQVPQVELMQGERPRIDLTLLPRAPAADVLLLKLSYWFG